MTQQKMMLIARSNRDGRGQRMSVWASFHSTHACNAIRGLGCKLKSVMIGIHPLTPVRSLTVSNVIKTWAVREMFLNLTSSLGQFSELLTLRSTSQVVSKKLPSVVWWSRTQETESVITWGKDTIRCYSQTRPIFPKKKKFKLFTLTEQWYNQFKDIILIIHNLHNHLYRSIIEKQAELQRLSGKISL